MRLLRMPGVFRPRSDAWLLIEALRNHCGPGRSVLDVFTGSGVVAVAAGLHGADRVGAVDVSRRAVACARVNGRLNGVRVDARRGDLLAPFRGERFDIVTANPPYVPGEGLPSRGAARAWEGGAGGRALLDRFCREVATCLLPGGTALLVQSSLADGERSLELLRKNGLEAAVMLSRRGPLGPLVAGRAAALEQAGILAPGAREEQLLVIAAVSHAHDRDQSAAASAAK